MAHHKNIAHAHALLEGEGWHIMNPGSQRKLTDEISADVCIIIKQTRNVHI